ncbi:arabinose 5-phosphate isomerase KdsD [Burkholderia vietnamiensis]|uniref:arabinose 5-phosphate isomerase KdsD n=1 Tax=Burkholderia vietnamiensis TaxID=60552 RepID=UPI001CF0F4AE|nr:arabinose 5-phosphate isomerase KdsD [Burkholderia vietnamiensis]MCA8286402.1 KpsF/GutQ family sugar-phosphate isomerase [Burkholderia vietnamiensis]
MIAKINDDRALALARDVLDIEADAVRALRDQLDGDFVQAVALLLGCRGRVVVSGIGKSGHIARKIAATLASTGTPAFFVHPAEASHGDLGMVTADDVFIGISYSGESEELVAILPLVKRIGAKLIAITGRAESSLGKLADVHLNAAVSKEACPLNLAPTASTTAALALGDALAVAVLDARGFGSEDFARSHPGGALGRRLLTHVRDVRLLTHVRDVMRSGADVPRVGLDATLSDALFQITEKRLGMTAVVDPDGRVAGIFTDGDLRRVLARDGDFRTLPIVDVMTRAPRTIGPDQLAVEAVELMERHRINQMLVVDANGMLIGALNMHDLFSKKVI